MIRKTIKKLVYGLKTRYYESEGRREELLAIDHRVDLLRAGEGPPLVYLHGLLGEMRWLPFHKKLAESFDVIAPAHPGYGASEMPDGTDTIEDVVFHYLDVLDGLGLERAHFVGVSLGGWIAAEIAVRHPERIDRLVLADALGLSLDTFPVPDVAAPGLFADPKGPVAEYVLRKVAPAIPALPAWAAGLADPKLERRLRRISRPTLVVWGDRDPVLPLAYAETFRDRIPGAELALVRGAGHLPQFEQEARFVEVVTDFLKK